MTHAYTCECGQTLTLVPDVVMPCCYPEHKHHCIIAKEHDGHTLCLCSCGATRTWDTDWDEP